MQRDIYNSSESEQDKEDKIESAIRELETIDYQGINDDAFDYSNDENVSKLIPQITQLSNEIPAEIRTVVVVGSGPLWNIPKQLSNIDLIISLDINKNQLGRNKSRREEILLAESPNDLLPVPNINIDNSDIVARAKERRKIEAPHIEMTSYANYHYLSSEVELQKSKDYLRKAKIAYVCGDISDKSFTTQFGNILNSKGANIVFAGFSNVSEWLCGSKPDSTKRDDLINSLNLIPVDKKCPILHSRSIGRVGRSPILSKLSVGLESYGKNLMYISDQYKDGKSLMQINDLYRKDRGDSIL
jgi:hypothetical protein